MDLRRSIREIPDFPKPGIGFKDITTLLKDPAAFRAALSAFEAASRKVGADAVLGIESRGFIFGAPLADRLGAPFVPVRKKGKLPAETYRMTYDLEYGTDTIEIHRDALAPGAKVLLVDDLLATGGTAAAACALVRSAGAEVAAALFVVELDFLGGRAKLPGVAVESLVRYAAE